MIYKNFKNLLLPSLGVGTMRLPTLPDGTVDEEACREMFSYAMEHGVNYFDTAYGYHNGKSEEVCGKLLSAYPRESYYLTTKFPGYDLSNMNKVEEIFEEQLKKCRTDYFDFYLFHNVYERNVDPYLDPKYGILEYLLNQKENGRIRHLGFSVHGSYNIAKRFLDAYGEHMEFCQIQLNYLDWNFQNAKAKVELMNERNIPIWVMEGLRGGMLASLSEENTAKLKEMRPDESVVGWAFRFLQSVPGVTVSLSGMSNLDQLKDNIRIFSEDKALSESEMKFITEMADEMVRKGVLPCTACRYCTSHCPKHLDIPRLLELYNEHSFTGGGFIAPMAVDALDPDRRPNACIGCRSCEAVCPQQIKISEAMADFSKMLGLA